MKIKLNAAKVPITALAEKLGMSQPALSAGLNVKDVKTGLLERICSVTSLDMSFFYPDAGKVVVYGDGSQVNCGIINSSDVLNRAFDELAGQRRLTEIAHEQTGELLKQNARLLSLLERK